MNKHHTKYSTNKKDRHGSLIQIFENFLDSSSWHTDHQNKLLSLIKIFRILNNFVCLIENNCMHNVKDKSEFIEQIREHGHLFRFSLEGIKKCIKLDEKMLMNHMQIEEFLEYTPKVIELLDAAIDEKWDLILGSPKELIEYMKKQIIEIGNILVEFINCSVTLPFRYALFGR